MLDDLLGEECEDTIADLQARLSAAEEGRDRAIQSCAALRAGKETLESRLSVAEEATHRSVVAHNGTINELRDVRAALKLANGRLSAAEEELEEHRLRGDEAWHCRIDVANEKLKRAEAVVKAANEAIAIGRNTARYMEAVRQYEEGKNA